jgi:hypothetical protein
VCLCQELGMLLHFAAEGNTVGPMLSAHLRQRLFFEVSTEYSAQIREETKRYGCLRKRQNVRTSKRIDGRSTRLLDLSNNTRRTTRCSHHVCKRLERTRPFRIRRRWFPVVYTLSRSFTLCIFRKGSLSLSNSGRGGWSKTERCGLLERRRRCKRSD